MYAFLKFNGRNIQYYNIRLTNNIYDTAGHFADNRNLNHSIPTNVPNFSFHRHMTLPDRVLPEMYLLKLPVVVKIRNDENGERKNNALTKGVINSHQKYKSVPA